MEYIKLIDFFLKKRDQFNGFESDFYFDFNELKISGIENLEKLNEMLENFKTDKVLVDYNREKVIDDYVIDNNKVTIIGSSKDKFRTYQEKIGNNKINLNSRHLSPLHIPPGTKWENITIKFLNGHDVMIMVSSGDSDQITIRSNYASLGFQNLKNNRPNVQWILLKHLADDNGTFSWDNPTANVKIKKTKQNLSKQLKLAFRLTDDPFFVYRETKSYQIKINLIREGGQ